MPPKGYKLTDEQRRRVSEGARKAWSKPSRYKTKTSDSAAARMAQVMAALPGTRPEIAKATGMSPVTLVGYLRMLRELGVIEVVIPNGGRHYHYQEKPIKEGE